MSALDALGLIICDTLTFEMGVMDEWEASERLSKVRASVEPCSFIGRLGNALWTDDDTRT